MPDTQTARPDGLVSDRHQPASPRDLASPRTLVGDAREHEQEIRQSIQVDDHELGESHLALQGHHPSFGPTTDGSRDVKRRRFRCAARQNERPQGIEFPVAVVVSPAFALRVFVTIDPELILPSLSKPAFKKLVVAVSTIWPFLS